MKVLSVNVGMSRAVEFHGKLIKTSIFNEPVEGRVMVRRLNIDGDRQTDLAAHGGEHRAVFVYQAESYQYWRQELKRPDLYYGQFGENLTVEGLADKDVCIGDRYAIAHVGSLVDPFFPEWRKLSVFKGSGRNRFTFKQLPSHKSF